ARITGAFEGVQFKIDNRDSNTLLYMRLQPGYEVLTKPGTLVSMDAGVQVKGKMHFSWKKLFTGGELTFAHFFGPGEVVVAPETWGDVAQIQLDGSSPWHFGKHAFLACTPGIQMTTKSQSVGMALFSGSGLFVGVAHGAGMLFVHGMGAVIARELQSGEQWIVNNDHLVAWNCQYSMERIQAGGIVSTLQSNEGAVCRFTGPGTVYTQSRSPEHLINWINEHLPQQ
ncbi:TRAP-like protein, partial [Daedalea quercina L-15889]